MRRAFKLSLALLGVSAVSAVCDCSWTKAWACPFDHGASDADGDGHVTRQEALDLNRVRLVSIVMPCRHLLD
jgi:hypothetical protein